MGRDKLREATKAHAEIGSLDHNPSPKKRAVFKRDRAFDELELPLFGRHVLSQRLPEHITPLQAITPSSPWGRLTKRLW
jgi:hypothetical protein